MAAPTFDVSSSLLSFDAKANALFIKLKAQVPESTKLQDLNKLIIIAIDKSGSMAGSGITQAKQAIIKLIEELHANRLFNITVVSYQSTASIHPFKNRPFQSISQEISNISAGGGTSFDDAFRAIGQVVTNFVKEDSNSRDAAVIFFTDGQDTPHTIPQFKQVLAKSGANTAVHTIGFTADHDARLLNEITSAGTVQGTFQYVRSSDEIPQAMDTISKLVITDGMSLAAKLSVPNSNPMKLFLEDDLDSEEEQQQGQAPTSARVFRYKCVVFIPREAGTDGMQLLVSNGPQTSSMKLAPQQITNSTDTLVTETTLAYVQSRVMEMKDSIIDKSTARESLEDIRTQVDLCDAKLDEIAKSAMRTPSIVRKRLMGEILEAKQLVAAVHSCLSAAFARTLTNDKIATLNSLAYKGVTKKGLQKKLDKRVESNVALFEKLDQRITQEVAKLNFAELEHKYPELENKTSACALSCMSWVDALKDADCLCIALDIGRSQAAIADPTQMVIRSIRQTFVSAESFMSAVQYSLVNKDAKAAHGGFDKSVSSEDEAPSVVVGQARETITGALPLFLNRENWGVAKHKMKPLLGWMTTLDVLGYTFAQIKALPFLVLSKAARDLREAPTEWTRNIFGLILETCVNIYRDASAGGTNADGTPLPTMAAEIKSLFQRYISGDKTVRTVDAIANNDVFLAHLLVAMHAGDIVFSNPSEVDNLFSWMAEEELRRKQPPKYRDLDEAGIKALLFKVLNINVDRYITAHVNAYNEEKIQMQRIALESKSDSYYSAKMSKLLSQRGINVSELTSTISTTKSANNAETTARANEQTQGQAQEAAKLAEPQDEIDGIFPRGTLSEEAQKMISDNEFSLVNFVAPILKLKALFLKTPETPFEQPTFASIGLASTECQLAAVVQNMMHSKNADRRDAITNGTYVEVQDREQSCAMLKKLYVDYVLERRNQLIREIDNRIAAEMSNQVATVFGITGNLIEAAGALHGCFKGRNIRFFFLQLQEKPCPLAVEKMKMLFSGQFHGVALFVDQIQTRTSPDAPVPWQPSKKNLFRMWMTNRNVQSADEWRKLAQSISPKHDHWMSRWILRFEGPTESTTATTPAQTQQ